MAGSSPPAYSLAAYLTIDQGQAYSCAIANVQTDAACAGLSPVQHTLQTSMTQAFMGFTMGQDAASGAEEIVIDNFKAQGR